MAEYPKETNTYCPSCRKHSVHKVKLSSKGGRGNRSMAKGNRKHDRKLEGYGGKRKGLKTSKKNGKRQVIVMECSICKKKHQRTIGTRTKKKLEIKNKS